MRRRSALARPSSCGSSTSPARAPPTATAACSISPCSVPERADLGRWLAHAGRDGVQLTGASDHYVSEALYLRDPDRHGIEIYADRPRELWEGHVDRMGSWPLDLDDLLATVGRSVRDDFEGLPDGTTMGHVHLRVADVDEIDRLLSATCSGSIWSQGGAQAAFLSAGGLPPSSRREHVGEPRRSPGARGHGSPSLLHGSCSRTRRPSPRSQHGSAGPRQRIRPATGSCSSAPERSRQRLPVDDDERFRRPRQRDVELAHPCSCAAISAGSTTTTWSNSSPFASRGVSIGIPSQRSPAGAVGDELVGRDHGEQPARCAEPRSLVERLGEHVLRVRRAGSSAARRPCDTRSAA